MLRIRLRAKLMVGVSLVLLPLLGLLLFGLDENQEMRQQVLQRKEPVLSDLILGRTVKRPAVVAAAPILDADSMSGAWSP